MTPISYGIAGLLLLLLSVVCWGCAAVRKIKRLTAFAGYLSHEISSPLFANRTGAQLLVHQLEARPEMGSELRIARDILAATDMAFETIAAFRVMARKPLRWRRETAPKQLDASLALKTLVSSFEPVFHASAISVRIEIEPVYTRAISIPEFSLIARQLIRNAVQSVIGDIKPPKAEKEITVKLYREEKQMRSVLEISDNGIGMDARTRRNCTRFGFSGNGQSRGIGLFVVARTVKKNKLKLKIESQKGNGSTFRLFIPMDGEFA